MKWKTDTKYGDLDITVNLSKPEKDPKAIAAAKLAKAERLSEMPALQGECGLCGTRQPPGAPEPPHYPDHGQ